MIKSARPPFLTTISRKINSYPDDFVKVMSILTGFAFLNMIVFAIIVVLAITVWTP